MECKYCQAVTAYARTFRINRYIMECKYIFGDRSDMGFSELIDTLWNVNR